MNEKHGDEFEKIRTIKTLLGPTSERVLLGIGDDAAIVQPPRENLLLCTDAFVEGVHFDLAYASAADVGYKAVASTLSDIAAMNGVPLYLLLSIAMSPDTPDSFLKKLYEGARSLAREFNIDIIGGDLTVSKRDLFIDVVAVGEAKTPAKRSGARPGDSVYVSGTPGLSAAGLQALRSRTRTSISETLSNAHLRPRPRFDLLPDLQPHAMIDLSDGLSSELHHIANASDIHIAIDSDRIPLHSEAIAEVGSRDKALDLAFSGGEDYELLVTTTQILGEGWTWIGSVHEGFAGVSVKDLDGAIRPLVASGYNHFKS